MPSELFGDFLDVMEESYYKEKKKVKEMLKELGITLTPSTDPQSVINELAKSPNFAALEQKNLQQIVINVRTFPLLTSFPRLSGK